MRVAPRPNPCRQDECSRKSAPDGFRPLDPCFVMPAFGDRTDSKRKLLIWLEWPSTHRQRFAAPQTYLRSLFRQLQSPREMSVSADWGGSELVAYAPIASLARTIDDLAIRLTSLSPSWLGS